MSNINRASAHRRRSRSVVIAGGGVIVAAAVAAALGLSGAASAAGDSADPSIRQLSDGSWVVEDTFQDPTVIENGSAPEQMIEEGSDVDPGSDMLVAPDSGQL